MITRFNSTSFLLVNKDTDQRCSNVTGDASLLDRRTEKPLMLNGPEYDITLILKMPETEDNIAHGPFKVKVDKQKYIFFRFFQILSLGKSLKLYCE